MSVTGFMYNINATKKLAEMEIQEGLEGGNSWHNKYKHSAYVYIGGLHTGLTEGDVVIMFSQFGEIVDVNVVRDKTTGKSKGFAFICYEDQRSTILAVDNMNGFQLLGRTIRVDHVEKYKAPKRLDENDKDENGDAKLLEYEATGAEGKGYKVYNALDSQKNINDVALQRRKTVAAPKGPEDEDEAWAKQFEDSLKNMGAEPFEEGKVQKKKKKSKKELKKDKEDLAKVMEEMKKLKKEAKKAKEESKRRKDEKKGKAPKPLVKSEKAAKSEAGSGSSPSSSSSSSSDSSEKPKKRKK